jgi:hypothetical protein
MGSPPYRRSPIASPFAGKLGPAERVLSTVTTKAVTASQGDAPVPGEAWISDGRQLLHLRPSRWDRLK